MDEIALKKKVVFGSLATKFNKIDLCTLVAIVHVYACEFFLNLGCVHDENPKRYTDKLMF